ncbi:6,7-dimethyl-8-ribityllumazine synthase [Spongiibacter sp. IMCC21906]|uniref:6,7-dimethyl-8-ribityllumazine synthase n=1 Tax=Spongiibacter sp. IMCC21906 TaxID=1620392 RepID=UPI00062DFD77|nr:6,7-dimethyl-8-ribityllumazine synthase [Spongiibacter sp. IMCC21906]AKH70190.1 6,7-dimethyl-8-ribityllumazine synthase [Spongiibacter sp. IMCC21906]
MTSANSTASNTQTIAFIQACWHKDIVDRCKDAFLKEISTRTDYNVECFEVPGAFEIPLHAKLLAQTGKYAAIVGTGLVTNSGIYRHEYVAQAVVSGLMQVQLETMTPVFSVVLTPHNFHNSDDHTGFFREHFVVKGIEAANACIGTLNSLASLPR